MQFTARLQRSVWSRQANDVFLIRDEALKQGRWRQTPEGHIEKGPFPAEKTSINVTPLGTHRDSGETSLLLTPRNVGNSRRIFVAKTAAASEQHVPVHDLEDYRTTAATLYFIAIDSTGKYPVGEPTRWTADLTVRHEIHKLADTRKIELRCTQAAEMRYTLDGTNPKEGTLYARSFPVPGKGCTTLVAAKAGEVEKSARIPIPAEDDERIIIDDHRKAQLSASKRVSINTTDKVFGFIQRFKDRPDTLLRGYRLFSARAKMPFRSASTTAN